MIFYRCFVNVSERLFFSPKYAPVIDKRCQKW
jgi:hypothetical protein